jgi:competence protein ComEC
MVIMAGAVFSVIRLSLAAIPAIALRYPDQEMGGGGRDAGRARLSADLGSGLRHGALLHHDLRSCSWPSCWIARRCACATWRWPRSPSCWCGRRACSIRASRCRFAAVVALVSAYEWLRTRHEEREPDSGMAPIGQVLLFLGGIITSTLVASLSVAPFGIYHFPQHAAVRDRSQPAGHSAICNLLVMPAAWRRCWRCRSDWRQTPSLGHGHPA